MTFGASSDKQVPPGAPMPRHGKPIGKLSPDDFTTVVEKAILSYSE